MEGAVYGTYDSIPSTVAVLRSQVSVCYCVRSMWFTRSFKDYNDALHFVERLKVKYKRITYLSIDVATVLIDNLI